MQAVAAQDAPPLLGAQPFPTGEPGEIEGRSREQTEGGALAHTHYEFNDNTGGTEMRTAPSGQRDDTSVASAVQDHPTPAPPATKTNTNEFSDYEDDDEDIDPDAPPVVFGFMDLGDMLPTEVREATEQIDPIRTKADALGMDKKLVARSSHFRSSRSTTPSLRAPASRMSRTPRLSSPFNNLRLSTPGPASGRERSISQSSSNASIGTRIDGRSAPAHCPYCDRRYAREIDMQRHVETSCQEAARSMHEGTPESSTLGLSQGWQYRIQNHVCEVCGMRLSRRDALTRHLFNQHRRRTPKVKKTGGRLPTSAAMLAARATGGSTDGNLSGDMKHEVKLEDEEGLGVGLSQPAQERNSKNGSSSELTDLDYFESEDESAKGAHQEAESPNTLITDGIIGRLPGNPRKRTQSVASAEDMAIERRESFTSSADVPLHQVHGGVPEDRRDSLNSATSSRDIPLAQVQGGHRLVPARVEQGLTAPAGHHSTKRQKKTRFWTYSKSPEPHPRPARTPSPMNIDMTPGPARSSLPAPQSAASSSTPDNTKGLNPAAREAVLRADDLAHILDPYRVKCRRCGTVIKLSDKLPWMLRMWQRHKLTRGCLAGTGRTAPWPRRQGPGSGGDGQGGSQAGADRGEGGTGGKGAATNGQTHGGGAAKGGAPAGGEMHDAGHQRVMAYTSGPQSIAADKAIRTRLWAASPSPAPSSIHGEGRDQQTSIAPRVPSIRIKEEEPVTLFSQRMPAVDWVQQNEAYARALGLDIDEDATLHPPPATGLSDESQATFATHERPLTPPGHSSGDMPVASSSRRFQKVEEEDDKALLRRQDADSPPASPRFRTAMGGRPVYHLTTDAREESVPLDWEMGTSARKRKRPWSTTMSIEDNDEGYGSGASESDSDFETGKGKASRAKPKRAKGRAASKPNRKRKMDKHTTPAGTYRRGRPPKNEQPQTSAPAPGIPDTEADDAKLQTGDWAGRIYDTRCPHCKAKFGRPADVRRHVAYICPALQGKRSLTDCTCVRCGAVMARPDALERHHRSAFDCVDGTVRKVWPMGKPDVKSTPKATSRRRRKVKAKKDD